MKLSTLVLVIVLGVLQYHLWFANDGIIDMLRTKNQLAAEMKLNDKLKQTNEELLTEIKYLKNHDDAIEAKARTDLGMIKKDETFYQVVRKSK